MSELTLKLSAQNHRDEQNVPTIFELCNKPITPCPFCASTHITIRNYDFDGDVKDDEGLDVFWGHCMSCQCEGPAGTDRLHALLMWQARDFNPSKCDRLKFQPYRPK